MIERFNTKWKEDDNGCWNWLAYVSPDGYGRYQPPGRSSIGAHRVSYELYVGPIPEGMEIDHLCKNTQCVNPDHMEPVTHQENIRRGNPGLYNKIKTHCPRKHPYDGDNLYVDSSGRRHCCECRRAASRRCRRRKRLIAG